jgi:integrase
MSEPVHSTNATSTSKPVRVKPEKPYPGFPLYAHASGKWAKSIRGRVRYFGTWEDPQGALREYEEQKQELHAGVRTQREMNAVTVEDLFDAYLESKEQKIATGELSRRTWTYYWEVLRLAIKSLGKRRLVIDLRPADFAKVRAELAKRWGLHRLATAVQYVRSAFKYGYAADLIDRVVKFGPDFVKPSAKTMRVHKAKRGSRMFEAHEIRAMLDQAGSQLRCMILLGVNGAMGNADCGLLPLSALDLEGGWLNYPRVKTGIDRRIPLWPETIQAIREVLASRKDPDDPDAAQLLFITKYRKSWAKDTSANPISAEMGKLLKALSIDGHRNFYALRHAFRTIADEAKDRPATDHIMGHTPAASDVGATHYLERIADHRLRAVAEHVRSWLLPEAGGSQVDNSNG